MKVSVITVCFNSKKTIADTLRSVHEQSYKDIEHIVVDGASSDGTLEVIGRTPNRIARFLSEPDEGIYDAMNKGISMATGDIVGFLNSDDVYASEGSLEKIVDAFDNPNMDACYGDVLFVAADNSERIVRYWKAGPYSPGSLAKGWMPPHPTFYVRRHVYERAGGFDPAYHFQADFEMAIRLIELQKIPMRYIPNTLVRMRMGGASNASIWNVVRGNMEACYAVRKHNLPVGLLFPVRKILSRIPQFFSRPDHRSQR
jgi:glycosyltransferase involved in cell wall biosynthesis